VSFRRSFAALGLVAYALALGCGDGDDAEREGERCGAPSELSSLPDPGLVFTQTSAPAVDYYSPRAADLDGDGKLEILASGGNEFQRLGELVALDGTSGDVLWRADAEQQLYGSPVFVDVTGDGVLDVFVGGRNEAFIAVDGANGDVLWRFVDTRAEPDVPFYNFYTAIPIDDSTGDGLSDLLLANGGYDMGAPGEPRPPGHLLVLDAKTGALVASAVTPDAEETYMSPLIVPDAETGSPSILFGTGGETRSGALWRTTLDDVLAGDINGAENLVAVEDKGVIAPPAFADIDGDERLDVIVAPFDGRLIALSGANDEVLWELTFEGTETYSTPTLGFFDDDEHPDVFAVFLHGVFPDYVSAERVVVSGRNGSVLWRGETGTFTMAGDVAIDLDGDARDEVIFNSVDWNAELGTEHTLHLFATASLAERTWGAPLGLASFASPWVGDLDVDGCVDLVAVTRTPTDNTYAGSISRFRIAARVPDRISWGGYLGTGFDSTLAGHGSAD
jgi:outer membrane protein assembly factor BamB